MKIKFSEKINPRNLAAHLDAKEKPEKVRVLAIAPDGEMLVLRASGDVRSIRCAEDTIKECRNIYLRN